MAKTYEALSKSEAPFLGQTGIATGTPRLSTEDSERVRRNLGELSMVEGNILGVNKNVKTIYLTSCFHSEGKSTAAVNMAMALTMNGNKKVLLVDGNPRTPALHKLFSTSISPGLAEFFFDDADRDSVVRATAHDNLSIMTFGTAKGKRLSLFNDDEHKSRMIQLREQFDYILFDGNSVMGSSDSAIIANYFDGIVLVVECESTKKEVVDVALKKLRDIGGNVLGLVLNKRKFYIPKSFYGLI